MRLPSATDNERSGWPSALGPALQESYTFCQTRDIGQRRPRPALPNEVLSRAAGARHPAPGFSEGEGRMRFKEFAAGTAVLAVTLGGYGAQAADASKYPIYEVDRNWPKEFPNKMLLADIGGNAVDDK